MSSQKNPLGIDIGGTGIKGAPVDLKKGEFAQDRLRLDTPDGATPEAVLGCVEEIVDHFGDVIGKHAAIGITIPAVVMHGVVKTAANIDDAWIDYPVEDEFEKALGRDITVLNDADAAGLAESRYGAAKKTDGLVVLTTLGTGIGTAILSDGVLVPNSELGHLELDGHDAETRASSKVRSDAGMSYEDWAKRLTRYYTHLENLLWPDLFVVGGGVSKKSEKFLPLLEIRTPIVPAKLQNAAGIVGAAREAADRADRKHGGGKHGKKK